MSVAGNPHCFSLDKMIGYLENRFKEDCMILKADKSCGMVHLQCVVGFHFYRQATVLKKKQIEIKYSCKKTKT
jgi:hypothetical protein